MMVSKLRGVFAAPALALGMGVSVLGATSAFAAPADEFNAELQSGYTNLAAGERSEFDYVDGRMFQTKADKVAAGGSVLPEVISDWNLMDEDVAPITDARARLMDAINGGVIDVTPVPLARAQWNFDCWVQEAEENMQPEHVEPCRQGFESAMADIRYPEPEPEPEPETIEPIGFSVYFDFDSSALDAAALNDIATAAEAAVSQNATSVEVGGHTDSSGSDAYNDRLSRTRAEVVAAQLASDGVNAALINTTSFGESRPAVTTGDGVRERANRRAEIVLYFGGEMPVEEEIDFGEPEEEAPAADEGMAEDEAASDIDDLFSEEEPVAEDEAPAMDEEPMMDEEPAMEDEAPMMDEEPAMDEEPMMDEEPAMEDDAPMMDEEPAMDEEPVAEEAPAMDEGMDEEPAMDEAAADESAEDELEALFAEDDGTDDGLDGILE